MKIHPSFTLLLIGLILVTGCKKKEDPATTTTTTDPTTDTTGPRSFTGTGSYTLIPPNSGGEVTFTQELGTTTKDIYFIYTNSSSATATAPTATLNQSTWSPAQQSLQTPSAPLALPLGQRGTPTISAQNNGPQKLIPGIAKNQSWLKSPQAAAVGDTYSFKNTSATDLIPATLRKVLTDGSITVNMWVANDAWTGCALPACVTQSMLDAVAGKFLLTGADNDIYDWVTNALGAPWGTHSFKNIIAPSAANQIDILYFDISADRSQNGGIVGFFWSKDNFIADASTPHSNERLMFYMDSVLLATPEGSSWEITDTWPADNISTLAHEFQHMIHYYQKNILLNGGAATETWLNELCSMQIEDLLADKLGNKGPRGVASTDPTAGAAGNKEGRMPLFVTNNFYSITEWNSDNTVLRNYAINYAFGAYLTRNFGGAALLKSIVQDASTDSNAVANAVAAQSKTQSDGSAHTLASILAGWGIANLLSDTTTAPTGFTINSGANFTSTVGTTTYNQGSINFYNYGTPKIFTLTEVAALKTLPGLSNTYIKASSAATGSYVAKVTLPAQVGLAVVVK